MKSKGFVWSGWIKPVNSEPTGYFGIGIDFKTGKVEEFYIDKHGNKTNPETKSLR